MTRSKGKQSFHRHTIESFSKNNQAWKKIAQLMWPLELVKDFFPNILVAKNAF